VAATSDGLLDVHPLKVKTAGIPTAKLMSLFGVELDDILKSRPDKGINIHDNEVFLDPARMLPAPQMKGHLTNSFIRGDRLVQVFGKGGAAAARQQGNYIWFRGASIRFGRLTMSDADLVDRHGSEGSVRFLPERLQRAARGGVFGKHTDHAPDLHA
jgi:hypothetical protein